MKRIIVFLMCVLVGVPAMAEQSELPCSSGLTVTSHKATDEGCSAATCNEHTFCRSGNGMNWWSAFTWCESQGRKLVNFSTICPGVAQTPSGYCPNLKGISMADRWMWSSLAINPSNAFIVRLSSEGTIAQNARTMETGYEAFCE